MSSTWSRPGLVVPWFVHYPAGVMSVVVHPRPPSAPRFESDPSYTPLTGRRVGSQWTSEPFTSTVFFVPNSFSNKTDPSSKIVVFECSN